MATKKIMQPGDNKAEGTQLPKNSAIDLMILDGTIKTMDDLGAIMPFVAIAREMKVEFGPFLKKVNNPLTFTAADIFKLARVLKMKPAKILKLIVKSHGDN